MGVQDHGGFDVVIAIDIAKLSDLVRAAVNRPATTQTFHVNGWGDLSVGGSVQLASITLAPDGSVTTTVTATTTLSWPRYPPTGGRIFDAGSGTFSVSVSVTGRPSGSGTQLQIDFPTDAAQVTIPSGTLEQFPAIQAYLAALRIFGTQTVENARRELYRGTEDSLENALNLLLPNTVRLGRLPRPPVTDVRTSASGTELRFLMTLGGSPGNPAAITRSRIQRGTPGDLAAVIVSNSCLLRDVVRPVVRAGFGLSNSGFISSHPCLWLGSAPFGAGSTLGITPNITSVRAGVDAAGMLQIFVSLDGTHPTGAFGFTGSFTLGAGGSVAPSGSDRRLSLTVSASAATSLDIWVAWWVYVGGVFVSPLLTLAIALTDAFAGGSLAGGLNSALRGALGAMTLNLPIPDGPLSLSGLSMAQSDAPLRTFTIPGPFPITVADLPMNDVIARFSA